MNQLFHCSGCKEKYSIDNEPIVLPSCLHNICRRCYKSLGSMGKYPCPFGECNSVYGPSRIDPAVNHHLLNSLLECSMKAQKAREIESSKTDVKELNGMSDELVSFSKELKIEEPKTSGCNCHKNPNFKCFVCKVLF